ncbi:sensor domain-containing diguanylate cyclase [Neptunicella marina]|uniref:diguanylate cyclase n=1 Tax=Neptunicella marina TaxID=2125989 RepID=A0A8J6IWQ1_9ALTE|nr:sensor domain-containing diguanylate cyclase [Neptunicella marina]MBC3766977.1 diguanylate cyclase [Neptunicella marina]
MNNTNDYVDVLMSFIHSKNDGYGLFNDRDQLVYCNDAYLDIMSINRSDVGKLCFEDILKINQATGRGIKVDSGNIDAFLKYVRSVRRSREYRLFEVDFVDGRWFIFSEQLNQNGYLLVHIKDITKQKVTQQTLQSSLSSYKYMALTDELTQVANRRSFVETVKTSLNNCENASVPMSLMIIDVDFFKSINDNFGHQIGDLVLKKLAQSLQQEIRPFDTIGRIGGEEFAIFLSNTTSDMAIRIAER